MRKVKLSIAFLIAALTLSLLAPVTAAEGVTLGGIEPPAIEAKHALLCDPASGEVLYSKDSATRAHPASLTKIMTALIVIEEGNMSDVATVTNSALEPLDPDSSVAGLLRDEEVTVENLLKMLLVASANDGANVLAEHLYGSVDKFVARMNERAAEIGCMNTHFMNTHGLTEDNHYTTAEDMYLITVEALKHPLFLEICNMASITVPATNKRDEQVYYTTNHLISNLKSPDYIYRYAKGIKTGHTTPAGYCLVSSAEKNGMFLVAVVMGSIRDESGKQMSFVDSARMYEWAFANYTEQVMLDKSKAVATIHVALSSETDYVTLVPSEGITALLPSTFDRESVELIPEIFSSDGVDAPVTRGDVMGSLTVKWQGREYGKVDLIALSSVSQDKTLLYGRNVREFFAQSWVIYVIVAVAALLLLYCVFVITINSRRKKERRRNRYYSDKRNRR